MTLCAAWIREVDDSKELIFATDSTLTGGEKWNHGVKLFELPRQDCMLCFAGETHRAYPLILNLTAAIKYNERLRNPKLDLVDVLYSVAELFTDLVQSIFNKPKFSTEYIGSEAKFLFGGWSWRENRFRIWRLSYSPDGEMFIYNEETVRPRVCVFLGDPEAGERNIAQIAEKRYQAELMRLNKFDGQLDMEPLAVLIDMCRDTSIYEVDGALQIGKIYRSGSSEFFGVMWPSVKGDSYFLGKRYGKHDRPRFRYYDPDTCDLIEDQIPKRLVNINDFSDSEDYEFLQECYSQEDNFLKAIVSERERERLIVVFREYAYQTFREAAEVVTPLIGGQTLTDND